MAAPAGGAGVRLLVVAALAALCGLAGGALAVHLLAPDAAGAQTMPRLVTAETFILQDKAGKSRVLITMLPDGRTGLAFLDDLGRPRAGLGFEANGQPGLAFLDDQNRPRAAFGIRADGTPALSLFDQLGNSQVELSVDAEGIPRLTVGGTQLAGTAAEPAPAAAAEAEGAPAAADAGAAPPAPTPYMGY